jgi:hypothetical protein
MKTIYSLYETPSSSKYKTNLTFEIHGMIDASGPFSRPNTFNHSMNPNSKLFFYIKDTRGSNLV